MTYRRFEPKEFSHLSYLMQNHHSLFYEMWKMGKPIFDTSIKTACITFNKDDGREMDYRINPDFWDTLNDHQKCFVIGHEQLHGVLNHGIRANTEIDKKANVAMDLVVNHTLIDSFDFDRAEVDPTNKYCWIDTIFKDFSEPVREHESFEYYYRMLSRYSKEKGNGGNGEGGFSGVTVDDHDQMSDSNELLKELGDKLPEEIKEQLKDFVKKHTPKKNQQAGKGTGGMEYLVPTGRVKKKKKWESVIKRWMQAVLAIKDKDMFQWARINRRFTLINTELKIPSEMEMEDHFRDEKKILVWFFQDTSGSCSDFLDRFFTAAESLPKERFDVKMHCFDTEVYETTLKSRKIYGGGGTSFSCIENYIQSYCKKTGSKYPEAVFVVTDGYGDNVHPEIAKNWFWFLSEPCYTYIPEKSNKYLLSNYE